MIATLALMQVVLRFQYPTDLAVTYDVRQSWATTDGEEETVYVERWAYTVSEQLAGGAARLKLVRTAVEMEIDGTKIVIDGGPGADTSNEFVEDHSPRGDVMRKTPPLIDPTMTMRLDRIADLFYPVEPVEIGVTWTRSQAGGLPLANWTWIVDSMDDGKAVGRFSFQESQTNSPIQAEGKFVASIKDGWPVELSFKALNTYQPGDEERLPSVYEFSMKRR
ncbi:MAG: hypothetical protein IH945_01430 [Armatimonadetes bacterium]|nr:hypothetical protein [Armatimonadota bacterium]